jgi:hypothetical protein
VLEKSTQAKVPAVLLLPIVVLALYPGLPANTQPEPEVALIDHPFGQIPAGRVPALKSSVYGDGDDDDG